LKSADGIQKPSNFEASLGGFIWRDKIWFLSLHSHVRPDYAAGRRLNADGTAGVDPQNINRPQARIIWQLGRVFQLGAVIKF
jgi:hypothetical protein